MPWEIKLERASPASFIRNGRLLALLSNVRQAWGKNLQGTNPLAYFATASSAKEKNILTYLTPNSVCNNSFEK
jgi:hypothetical protein